MDMKYVRDLARVDNNVMSVSPQTSKSTRPFVGIVVVNGDRREGILDARDFRQ